MEKVACLLGTAVGSLLDGPSGPASLTTGPEDALLMLPGPCFCSAMASEAMMSASSLLLLLSLLCLLWPAALCELLYAEPHMARDRGVPGQQPMGNKGPPEPGSPGGAHRMPRGGLESRRPVTAAPAVHLDCSHQRPLWLKTPGKPHTPVSLVYRNREMTISVVGSRS